MPPLVIEPPNSRRVDYNNGSPIAVREFIVTGCPTESDVYALFQLDGEPPTKIPNKMSQYPFLQDLRPGVDLIAFDFTLARDPNVQEKWIVTLTYREGGQITPLSPNDPGYIAIRGSTESGVTDLWRTYDSDAQFEFWLNRVAPQGNPLYSPTDIQGDIGGLKIDVSGRPSRTLTMYESIVVDVTVVGVPDVRAIRDTIGSRNLIPMLGLPTGAVLFRGARWTNIAPGKWQVSYDFLADYFYHLQQQPMMDRLGNPFLTGSNNAEYVAWVQPYRRLTNHRAMSPFLANLP